MSQKLKTLVFGGVLLLTCVNVPALEVVEGLTINGFLTAAGSIGDNDDAPYLNDLITDDLRVDTRDTRLGLQLYATINPEIQLTTQLLARGGRDNFDLNADWAFVSYSFTDQAQIRLGKVRFPTFLVSDHIEVGYSYPWIRPPQEVYTGNPITTIVGADALITYSWRDIEFLFQPYYGTRNFESVIPPAVAALQSIPVGTEARAEANNLWGINISAGSDLLTVRAGYVQTDVSSSFAGGFPAERARIMSAGLILDWENIIVYSEYYRRDEDGVLENFFPDQEAWYLTLGYRMGSFLPHITYADLNKENDQSPLALEQTSVTLGLRYELADTTDLKFEISRADPAENNLGLFDKPIDDALLFSFALDLIF